MGSLTPDGADLAERVVQAQLGTVGAVTAPLRFTGRANIACWATGGATGAVVVERSFDGDQTWLTLTNLGAQVNLPAGGSETIWCQEAGVSYRLRRVSGTGTGLFARISQ